MSTILAFNGSPRKTGNTHVLLSALLDASKAAGAQTELVHLGDVNIRECDGCHACWKGTKCAKADDMAELYAKIEAADVIVFGTPVYWYGPTGLMKLLIDRFVYFNCPANRSKIHGKRAALVIPYEDVDAATVRPVIEFFELSLRYLEMRLAGQVIAPGVTVRGEVKNKQEFMEEAKRVGTALAARAT